MRKKRILFFGEAVTLAHVARPIVLAHALDPDQYEIYLAWDPRYSKLFTNLPFNLRPIYSLSSEHFITNVTKGRPLYNADTLRKYVAEDLKVIAEIKPDLVVGDFRLSLAVSTPLARVPYMTISNAYWSPYANQHFPVPELALTRVLGVRAGQHLFNLVRPLAFGIHTHPLNKIRREHGLPSLGSDLRRIHACADMVSYADIPEMVPTYDLPSSHHYLGPILWSPQVTLPDWWKNLPQDKPIIYVTLGSSGRSDLLPTVLDALSSMPVTVIAATAGRIKLNHSSDNIFIADYLPGEDAAARAQLVICNGGSPTTQQALTQSIPVLGLPNNLDQLLNMEAVQHSGAGNLLRTERANTTEIRKAVMNILNNAVYSEAAAKLAQLFSKYNAAKRFSNLIAQNMASTAPQNQTHNQPQAHSN